MTSRALMQAGLGAELTVSFKIASTQVPLAQQQGQQPGPAAAVGKQMMHEYHEIPGGTHGRVIATGMPDIFAFFARHTKAR